MRVGFIGLGEAGHIYAAATAAAGHDVTGFDPAAPGTPDGVRRLDTAAEVVAASELVVVLTGASFSGRIAADEARHLAPGAIWSDFTTASAQVMREAEAVVEAAGGRFADVAVLGPVPTKGAATETMVSGSAAADVADFLRSLGAEVETVDAPAGEATSRKLLRSVMMKSLATTVVEALEAGRAAGCEGWVRSQVAAQLSGDADAKIERYVTGSRKHAVRRAHEMDSVVEHLAALGVEAEMSAASGRVLRRLAAEGGA